MTVRWTRRAQSSPRHACGLNVSEFPHTCISAEQAWLLGCWGQLALRVFCESLHRKGYSGSAGLILERWLGKVGGSLEKRVISVTVGEDRR